MCIFLSKMVTIIKENTIPANSELIFSGSLYSIYQNNTKIYMIVESYGLPLAFELTGGEVHDAKIAPALLQKVLVGHYIIADRGYDSEAIRSIIRDKGAIPVNPRKRNSKKVTLILIGASINIAT